MTMSRTAAEQLLYQRANRDIMRTLLTGLGIGGGLRGGLGLSRLLSRNVGRKPIRTAGPIIAKIPIEEDEEEEKLAEVTNKSGTGYYLPGMVLAGGAGLGIGWGAIDKLLDSRRKSEQQSELERARQEFENVLLRKRASALGTALDDLYDRLHGHLEKSAWTWEDLKNALAGTYGLYALGTGGVTGALAYSSAKGRQRRAVLDKAQKRRLSQRNTDRPSEIYAIPTRVPRQHVEEEEAPVDPTILPMTA